MPIPPAPPSSPFSEALRDRIRRLERGLDDTRAPGGSAPLNRRESVVSLGVPAFDQRLPSGGFSLGRLHGIESHGWHFDGPATAFTALLAARAHQHRPTQGTGRRVIWCVQRGRDDSLYPPGLACLGLASDQLLILRTGNTTDLLWAMEECLRSPAGSAVIGQIDRLDLTAARRLQLAAETGGGLGLLLRRLPHSASSGQGKAVDPTGAGMGVCVTRWAVHGLPAAPAPWQTAPLWHGTDQTGPTTSLPGIGTPRWSLDLRRCRGGRPFTTIMEWDDETGALRLATDLPDRPALPHGHAVHRVA